MRTKKATTAEHTKLDELKWRLPDDAPLDLILRCVRLGMNAEETAAELTLDTSATKLWFEDHSGLIARELLTQKARVLGAIQYGALKERRVEMLNLALRTADNALRAHIADMPHAKILYGSNKKRGR